MEKMGSSENYLEITRLNSELKKVESRIDTLKMREASGGDFDILMKIEKMEKDFSVEYKLHLYQL
jgi:ASC-1-like (ASCH) protein